MNKQPSVLIRQFGVKIMGPPWRHGGAKETQKKMSDLELEVQTIASWLIWLLGTESRSLARAINVLKHWAISPAQSWAIIANFVFIFLFWASYQILKNMCHINNYLSVFCEDWMKSYKIYFLIQEKPTPI